MIMRIPSPHNTCHLRRITVFQHLAPPSVPASETCLWHMMLQLATDTTRLLYADTDVRTCIAIYRPDYCFNNSMNLCSVGRRQLVMPQPAAFSILPTDLAVNGSGLGGRYGCGRSHFDCVSLTRRAYREPTGRRQDRLMSVDAGLRQRHWRTSAF